MTESKHEFTVDRDAAYRIKRRVTLVGFAVNLALAGGKTAAGVVGHSQALVADGIHSLSDLVSDGVILFAARAGTKGADAEHPYGHGRFETVATLGIGLLLILVATGFIYDAVTRLLNPERLLIPGWLALGAAVASVLANEWLYHYTVAAGRRVRSRLIQANAWHHRSDALSSIVVIIGAVGAMQGVTWFDAIAAIVVAALIGQMGWGFAWRALQELVDTGVAPQELTELHEIIDRVEGVRSHHELRTRRVGNDVLVDVHIVVDPNMSVAEGHRIGEEVRARLMQCIDDASEVLVHLDIE